MNIVRYLLLLMMASLCSLSASAQTCPGFPMNVASEAELNNAIACYNAATAADYEINITQDITLTAATTAFNNTLGASVLINGNAKFIDGAGSYRIFTVTAGDVTIDNSTLQNGVADTNPCNNQFCGGAVLISAGAVFAVSNSSLTGNSAPNGGGGAILNQGTLNVSYSTFNSNTTRYGGAIYTYENRAITTVSNSTLSGNSATGRLGSGGAIFHDEGTTSLYNVTVSANDAGRWGAGLYSNDGTIFLNNTIVAGNTDSHGGDTSAKECATTGTQGIFTVTASLDTDGSCGSATTSASINLGALQDNGGPTQTHALLSGSDAIDAGVSALCAASPVNNLDQRGIIRPQDSACDIGAFEVCTVLPVNVATEAELNNAIACYNTAAAGDYEINLTQNILLTASTTAFNNSVGANMKINGNVYYIDGAGSYRVLNVTAGTITIDKTILQNGTANTGGALQINSGADVTVTNSSILNSNSNSGGGIRNDGTLTVDNTLFSGNSTSRSGEGGGLSNYGTAQVKNSAAIGNSAAFGAGLYTRGTLTVSNSTISGNAARALAGGIYIFWSGNVNVFNTTISNSSANVGGGVLNNGGTFNLFNSIIANSTRGSNCYGTIGGSNSLADDGSCGSTTLSSNINLAALADKGCNTQHAASTGLACLQIHGLEPGSDAIDAGDNTICAASPVDKRDQRGIIRPQNNTCEIGALEIVVEQDDWMCFPTMTPDGIVVMICL